MKLPTWLKVWVFLYQNKKERFNFIDVIRKLRISSNTFYTAVEFLIVADMIRVEKEDRENSIILMETTKDETALLMSLYRTYKQGDNIGNNTK